MSVSIVTPIAADCPERERNWQFLRARYECLYPEWEIVTSDALGEPWSKGAALHDAIERASHDTLVVADADVMVGPAVLPKAVAAVDDRTWVVPAGKVYRLTEEITQGLIAGRLGDEPEPVSPQWVVRRPHVCVRGGGLIVVTRASWERSGGIDRRFEGWGGEDISLARALVTLVGGFIRLRVPMWHLCHPGQASWHNRRGSPANERLAARYLDAEGDPAEMRRLVKEAADERHVSARA